MNPLQTMSQDNSTRTIEQLQEELGIQLDNVLAARDAAEDMKTKLRKTLSGSAPADTSIVVFGSLARDEFTSGSDIDWTLLYSDREKGCLRTYDQECP